MVGRGAVREGVPFCPGGEGGCETGYDGLALACICG